MSALTQRLRRGRSSALIAAGALSVSVLALQSGGGAANASSYNEYVDAPTGEAPVPLPDDVILNYANGRPVASHYKFSYICPTAPENALQMRNA